MFLETGSNGWRDSTWLFETKKPECTLISINMAIVQATETAKFRKLKKWQHFKVKISIFLVLFVFWVVKKNWKKHQILKSMVHAIKVHPMKIYSKFQVSRSTWDTLSKSMDLRKTRLKFLLPLYKNIHTCNQSSSTKNEIL